MSDTPSAYQTITTVFCVKGADEFITFCKDVLGAEERQRRMLPNGAVMHVDLQVGDTIFWVTDSIKDAPTSSGTVFFTSECDAVYEKAIRHGAKSVFAPATPPWGGRWARVEDRWGNGWTFTTPRPAPAAGR
jgi:PhnB protein